VPFEGEFEMRKSESGYVLFTVAALLFVLVGFTALAVDMGTILSARTQIQRAADAAALAGAFSFTADSNSVQPDTAIVHATTVAQSNTVMGDTIPGGNISVSVSLPDATTNTPAQVTVTITRTEPMLFAKIFSLSGVADKVTAVAESGTLATSARCVKPFFIPNTVLSSQDACAAAAAGQMIVSNNQVTTYAKSNFGASQLTLKPSDASQALSPGDFYEIDIDGGGGSAYSNNISSCNKTQLVCRQSYDVLTGTKMGPTIQGVKDLIGQPPNDTYVGIGQYKNTSSGTISDHSQALVIAPITDLTAISGFCPAPVGTCTGNCEQFPSGSNVSIQVVGFALVFIETATGGNVAGRIVNAYPCGAQAPDAADVGSIAVPLRLVRKQ
jgi:Flp pilus assembly protein TadG